MTDEATERVYRVEVTAPPERAWDALTDPDTVRGYYFDTAPRTDWRAGSVIDYVDADGAVLMTGEVLDVDPPRTFSHTFRPRWNGTEEDQGTLTWTIDPTPAGCTITLVHAGGHGTETAVGSARLVDALGDLLGRA